MYFRAFQNLTLVLKRTKQKNLFLRKEAYAGNLIWTDLQSSVAIEQLLVDYLFLLICTWVFLFFSLFSFCFPASFSCQCFYFFSPNSNYDPAKVIMAKAEGRLLYVKKKKKKFLVHPRFQSWLQVDWKLIFSKICLACIWLYVRIYPILCSLSKSW